MGQQQLADFRRELLAIITKNTPGSSTPATPRTPLPSTPRGISTPLGSPTKDGSFPREGTPSRSAPGTPMPGQSFSSQGILADVEIRKRVLAKSPELAKLHGELVITGQVSEVEFWEGREVCACHTSPSYLL